jgi:glyoxylase-like metal-dependent hydrolase (beta-lactamase superfamily II)
MSDDDQTSTWMIGSVQLQRVPYFDIPFDAASIDLDGVPASLDWAEPWSNNGQPVVGQAFWIVRSDRETIVVDPCGASDPFLRTGPEAVDHQNTAFDLLRAASCGPADVDQVVLTHLDGIGMAALADGAPAGAETWAPAFPRAEVVISQNEYDFATTRPADLMGAEAFAQLDARGVVRPVSTPHEVTDGVTLRQTGAHSPGHCCIDIESEGERAVLLGHLAISPLHAAVGVSTNHVDRAGAWTALATDLNQACEDGALVAGSLWPYPGAAQVTETDPFVLVPAPNHTRDR